MRTRLCIALAVLLTLMTSPLYAQPAGTDDPLAWIPADFAGVVQLHRDLDDSLLALRMASLMSQVLQPDRDLPALESMEDAISLLALDVEDASFAQDIAPWLAGDLILAYEDLGRNLSVNEDDVILILPTRNMLQAASSLSRIIRAQDLLEEDTYRDQRLYVADKITLVLLPNAVVIGDTELVKAVLDTAAGDAARLIDDPAYQAVQANVSDAAIVSGYVNGPDALLLLSYALNADTQALPTLSAYGEALSAFRRDSSLQQLLLHEDVEAVGLELTADTLALSRLNLTLNFYVPDYSSSERETAAFNAEVLDMMPQSAMVVHSGTDATGAAYDLLLALPMTNFSSQFLGAFPVDESIASANGLLDTPDSQALERAVGGFLRTLSRQASYDLENDLLKHMDGSYALALLPRPNDPLPPLNMPYDILLVAEVDDNVAALNGVRRLAELILAQDAFDSETVGDYEFNSLRLNELEAPVLYMGMVEDRLVFATGNALEQSLDAMRGDNRLVSRERWQDLSGDWLPQLYVDLPAFYNTFLPDFGAMQIQQIVRQMAIQAHYVGDGVFQVDLKVTLPRQLR